MTALCLIPPTPAFKEGSLYECEPIPGGMVVYDNDRIISVEATTDNTEADGMLRQEVLDHLSGSDAILHGGDINNQGILMTLESIAPVYVVRGNNDKEWAEDLKLRCSVCH